MKKAGIILLVLQVVAMLGGLVNGNLARMFSFSSATGVFELLGFFLPAIIGVILLIKAKKKAAK